MSLPSIRLPSGPNDAGLSSPRRLRARPWRLALTLIAASLGACAVSGRSRPAEPRPSVDFAFVHASVLTMESPEILPDQTVLVSRGHIARMGPSASLPVPPGVPVEDCTGRYLVPGLADLHVHLGYEPEGWLPLFLANGVTTVQNMRGNPTLLALREDVRAGRVVGPTIYTTGPYRNLPEVKTPADAERVVAEDKAAGYDAVKIHGEFRPETFAALMASARAHGIKVTGHAPRNLRFDVVFKEGLHSIAHAEEMLYTWFGANGKQDVAEIAPLAKRAGEYGLWLSPTLAVYAAIARQWGRPEVAAAGLRDEPWARFLHPELRNFWTMGNIYTQWKSDPAIMERNFEFQRPLVKAMSEAGVHITLGTDTPLPLLVPGRSIHDEIAQLRAAGLSPWEVLSAGTRNAGLYAADILQETDRFGVVAPGARADLLVVERNPLEDLTTLAAPVGVMTRGRWHTRASLMAGLEALAERYAKAPPVTAATGAVDLAKYEGLFSAPPGVHSDFTLKLTAKDGRLLGEAVGMGVTLPLLRTGDDEFRIVGWPMRLVFSSRGDTMTVDEGLTVPVVMTRQ